MKSLIILGVLGILAVAANAQTFDFQVQNRWEATPKKHDTNEAFSSASAIGILDDRNIEYKEEGKEIVLITRYHRIIKINDDKGIEMFNKVYVPVYEGAVMSDLKARTILNGKMINIPSEKIKEIEEEGRTYKLFAMEGLEKGAEVEYSYTIKRSPTYFGMEVFENSSTPFQHLSFTLTTPEYLKFDAKGYNGFKVSSDSVLDGKRIIVGYDNNVVEMDEEKYAVRDPYLERVEYKLSYNLATARDVRLYSWKEFAKKAYSLYTTYTSKDEKAIINFLLQMKIDKAKSEENKILAIEDFIKSTINIDKDLVDENGSLEKMIKSKSANTPGIIRLFAAVLEKAGINYQLVFVGRRDLYPFDEHLENWNRVEETVLYFPNSGKYLSPLSIDLRYPYIPPYWAGSNGLFLKGTSIGTFKTAIGSFGEISMEPFESHTHNMEAVIELDKTLDTLLIHSKQILTGYGATIYRPIYAFLPKDKQEEANIEIIKQVAQSTDIKNIKVENPLLTDGSDNKPLIISADIKSTELLEKAGTKILLKIGEIIGQQVEMYQEKPRRLPIELAYPHLLQRKITLKIPDGYTIKNINDINISVVHNEGQETTMGFVSSYKQNGKIVTIAIDETYKKLKYPVTQFEDFKKVINAAADFNKVVLVLEKI